MKQNSPSIKYPIGKMHAAFRISLNSVQFLPNAQQCGDTPSTMRI